jgi:RNA polymerase sigma factor (sigma-70 family)
MAHPTLHALLGHIRRSAGPRDAAPRPDADLLARFHADRDEAAFAALVRRHGGLVLAACRRVLREPADVEDAFQATFLVLLRKAGSIRRTPSVGGWLYRVAHRVALQVRVDAERRRRHEPAGIGSEPAAPPGADPSWREVCGVLHAELDRLPVKFRLPLILCYLDGKTRDEAARLLGWSLGAVKGNLERGRKRLRARLERRGVALSAGLVAALSAPRVLAVPDRLVDSTLHTALTTTAPLAGGAADGRAALLAHGVLQTMRTTHRILVALSLLAVGAAGTGVGLLARPAPTAQAPPAMPAENKAPAAQPKPGLNIPLLSTITVTGRVLRPDGQPAAGAKLYSYRLRTLIPKSDDDAVTVSVGTADADGRFRVTLPRFPLRGGDSFPLFVAADGLGVDWVEPKNGADVTLKLVNDQPITGRLLDTEGRPLARAKVAANAVYVPPNGRLDEFLTGWKINWNDYGLHIKKWLYLPAEGVFGTTTTDAQGRFRLAGAGAERLVLLQVNGPGIAQGTLYVVNRPGFDPKPYNRAALDRVPAELRRPGEPPALYAPALEYVALPTKPIEGTVREAGTGKPVAGVQIMVIAGHNNNLGTVTDKDGHFRLSGVPKASSYGLHAEPPEGSELIARSVDSPDTDGLKPLTTDIELTRGIIVTGRVIDRATGKGVESGLRFAPLPDNTYFGKPGYDSYRRERLTHETDKDGRFRLAVIPGPGVLMAQAYGSGEKIGAEPVKPYKQADFTAEEKKRVPVRDGGDGDRSFTAAGNSLEFLGNENAVKVIDSAENAGTVTHDLFVDRGATLQVQVQDADGKPLAGAVVAGLTASWPITYTLPTAEATVYALEPGKPRQLVAMYPQRKLAAAVVARADDPPPKVLKLVPVGAVTGRVLDAEGQPVAGAAVDFSLPTEVARELYRHFEPNRAPVHTDADGRFRLENIVPDFKFGLYITKDQALLVGQPRIGLRQVGPGATLDLGDIRTKPQPR